MESENIPNFCAVTAADPSIAIGYLQVTDNNLEQAISLYFANDGQALHSDTGPVSSVGAAATTGGGGGGGYDEEDVRAPIAARRDVLVDDYDGGIGGAYGSIYSSGSALFRGGASRSSAATSIFNQGAGAGAGHVPFRDFAQEAAEIAAGESASMMSDASSRRNRLAELFKPPFDIMHSGDIDSARHEAMEDGKWVMINLQEVSDFKCQALNRDIWRQKVIKDIVRQDFVFFQVSIETAEGVKLATMYNAAEFPFVAVIHPKTGELRRLFARIDNVSDMVEDIANFLLDHPKPKKSSGGSAPRSETSSHARTSTSNRRGMTEEEELAAAIAASELESRGARSRGSGTTANPIPLGSDSEMDSDYENSDSYSEILSISSDDEADDDYGDEDEMEVDDALPAVQELAPEPEGPDAWYKLLPATEPTEPALGPTVTRIQFRFPNGQRVVRRFEKSAKVVAIFQYLKATLPEAANDAPEAQFMGKRLADSVEQTIDEAKLANASITIDI
ncbi:UBX domain protein Ubx2 [Coemansia aciculifera]|uniref:UBX domain protein Ubx2 n=1 Tax=Coemansia aciculifera TaxID=417176 RepID=A0A9W8IIB5_9FUNG|nr:UBX domain protein Ubx2 [Coemansia aciculifera]KAJ2871825.1 UBX domain protein Ubx2 [Coemansia aciculifera]